MLVQVDILAFEKSPDCKQTVLFQCKRFSSVNLMLPVVSILMLAKCLLPLFLLVDF